MKTHGTTVRVLRVFTDNAGRHGNNLGVVEGALVEPGDRQRVARELGFSETIFIDDYSSGQLQIFTPAAELPLAGHPLVGAAWVLRTDKDSDDSSTPAGDCHPDSATPLTLRPPGGLVRAWTDAEERTWIEAPLDGLPDWTLVELSSPAAIEDLKGPLRPENDHVVYWSWLNTGIMRVRCFGPRFGIAEDEATGSAALRLTALHSKPIEIRQGKGSLLFAQPVDAARAAVGGMVVEDDPLPLP